MDGNKILYSICVDDVKMVLKQEKDIDFDALSEDKQDDIIRLARKCLENGIDWYTPLLWI